MILRYLDPWGMGRPQHLKPYDTTLHPWTTTPTLNVNNWPKPIGIPRKGLQPEQAGPTALKYGA